MFFLQHLLQLSYYHNYILYLKDNIALRDEIDKKVREHYGFDKEMLKNNEE